MKRNLIVTLILTLILVACSIPTDRPPRPTPPEGSTPPLTSEPVPGQTGEAPLYLTTMTHMEHGFDDDTNQGVFEIHVQQLTYGMDLADEYGAILTIESEQPFAIANQTWDRNFMAEIMARGHGVGTHCDFGYHEELMTVEHYSLFFAENKALVDALVGSENNLGCSGGGGVNDWALAASLAGFKYIDGVVGMHYLAMPVENRPDATWTDEYILNIGFHMHAPVDLYQRIYPFMVADATDFFPDEDGVLLVSSGELGPLYMQAEGTAETGGRCPDCPYGFDDVDTLVALILEVDQNRDPDRVAKLSVYFPAADFVPKNEAVLRYFFEQMQALAGQGIITWATQRQVYEAYMAWNE
jgi:hypothetical protein